MNSCPVEQAAFSQKNEPYLGSFRWSMKTCWLALHERPALKSSQKPDLMALPKFERFIGMSLTSCGEVCRARTALRSTPEAFPLRTGSSSPRGPRFRFLEPRRRGAPRKLPTGQRRRNRQHGRRRGREQELLGWSVSRHSIAKLELQIRRVTDC